MSTRVYGWDQNPIVDRFAYRCSNTSAQLAIVDGFAFEVTDGDGRRAIQLVEPSPIERELRAADNGPHISWKAIALFIKTHCDGSQLHYEIPMAGDVGIYRHLRTRINVSSRNLFSRRAHSELFPAARAE